MDGLEVETSSINLLYILGKLIKGKWNASKMDAKNIKLLYWHKC